MTEERQVIELLPDVLSAARGQIDAGLFGIAEGTLRRRIATLVATARSAEELDAARALLAEALWRQGRPSAAGEIVAEIRPRGTERRRPLVLIIEAEALAVRGEPDRAEGLMERVVGMVGRDETWRLRAGVPSLLPWPPPTIDTAADWPPELGAAARDRLAAAKAAYDEKDHAAGDRELAVAVRLDETVAPEALGLIEPTLGDQPGADRLLLYGDLLRAAGRGAEASAAYDRAAQA